MSHTPTKVAKKQQCKLNYACLVSDRMCVPNEYKLYIYIYIYMCVCVPLSVLPTTIFIINLFDIKSNILHIMIGEA